MPGATHGPSSGFNQPNPRVPFWNPDGLIEGQQPQLTPKLATLVDAFNEGTLNTALWQNSYGSYAMTGSALELVGTSSYSGVQSVDAYDLTSSYGIVQITPPAIGSGSRGVGIGFDVTQSSEANGGVGWEWSDYGGVSYIVAYRYTTAGVQIFGNTANVAASTPFWVRIRESGGTVYWDYATDGINWTNVWTFADASLGFPLTSLYVNTYAGYYGTDSTFDAYFADFNIINATGTGSFTFTGTGVGSAFLPATGTATFTFAGAATGTATNPATATGSFTFTGAATGSVTNPATAAGTFSFAGAATGTVVYPATATGTFTFAGVATGSIVEPVTGTATGTFAFIGQATGVYIGPGPAPIPTVPQWPPRNVVTYKLISVWTGALLAELPLSGLTFTLGLNTPGPWAATLNVEDPNVQAAQWLLATVPYQTALLVDINGAIVYYGPTLGRNYTMSGQQVKLRGAEWPTYWSQRIQNLDYSAYTNAISGNSWATTGAPAAEMGYVIAQNALNASEYSLPIILEPAAVAPTDTWITATFPLTQAQTVASIWSQLTGLGYGIGYDYGCDPVYTAGIPTPIITLSYPRRGVVAGETGLVLDLASSLETEWDEDASTMSNGIVEMLGASGGISAEDEWAPSMETYGFPLTEQVVSHAAFSPTAEPGFVLNAFQLADLAAYSFPVTAPVVTLPLFNQAMPIGSFAVGDDVLVRVNPTSGAQPPISPRFPNGLSFYMRIVRVDVTIPDYGVPTMALTLNVPPGDSPIAPPAMADTYTGGGSGSAPTNLSAPIITLGD